MRSIPVLLIALAVSCGTASEPIVIVVEDDGQPDAGMDVPAPTGAELYAMHCETCHGPEALGGETWQGSIRGLEIYVIVTYGRETMLPVALDDDELDLVQEYLDSFGVDQGALTGREIFANRCAPCHGDTGEGTARSFPIRHMRPDFGAWVVRNGRTKGQFVGAMPAYKADEISDSQLDEIVDFMGAQPWPAGAEGLYNTFCSNCHGLDGRSGYAGKIVAGLPIATIVRSGRGGTLFGLRRSYMPKFTTDDLTDAALMSLDLYVQSL